MFTFNEAAPSGKTSKLLYYAILGYIVSLFMNDSPVVTNLFMAGIFVLAWMNVSPGNYFKYFAKNPVNIGLILFFVCELVSVLFSSDKSNGFDILRLRIWLLILPLAFCLIDFDQKTWRRILYFYVVFTLVTTIAGFMYGAFMAIKMHNPSYFYNDNISCLFIGKQAAYFSFYVNIAIFAIIHLLNFKSEHSKYMNIVLYISLGWLIFFNYMLASEMGSISLALILIFLVFSRIIRKKRLLTGAVCIGGLIAGVFVLHLAFPMSLVHFQRLANTGYRFDNAGVQNHFNAPDNPDQWSSSSTRLALWECGKEIWLKHPVTGTGLGDLRSALKEKYTENHFWFALSTDRNLHSQYMDILVSMGIIGLLVFLFTFILYPFKTCITRKQIFALCVFTGLAFCLLTENMFDRYQGEVLIAFILPLSLKVFDKKEEPAY